MHGPVVGSDRVAGRAGGQICLLVGSRAGDDVVVAPGPGRPGPTGPIGSIQNYRFDAGTVRPLQSPMADIRVGGSLVDPERGVIHVLHEVSANTAFYPGAMRGGGGDILTYRIGADGRLHPTARVLALGARPAQLHFAAGGRFVIQANRGAGRDGGGPCTTAEFDTDGHLRPRIHATEQSVICRRRHHDGSLGAVTDVFRIEPSDGGGLCSVAVDPVDDGRIVCCGDGGQPFRVVRLDRQHGRWAEVSMVHDERRPEIAGSLSRSVVFHPSRSWLYLHRHGDDIVSLMDLGADRPGIEGDVDASRATLVVAAEESSTWAAGFERGGMVIDAAGSTLYAVVHAGSDGGAGRIAVFTVDQHDGRPVARRLVDFPAGASPGCSLDLTPDGRHLAVACPESSEVLIFGVGPLGHLSFVNRFAQRDAAHVRFYVPADQPHRPSNHSEER